MTAAALAFGDAHGYICRSGGGGGAVAVILRSMS